MPWSVTSVSGPIAKQTMGGRGQRMCPHNGDAGGGGLVQTPYPPLGPPFNQSVPNSPILSPSRNPILFLWIPCALVKLMERDPRIRT